MKEKHNISFYYLNILIMLLVLLPKRSEILEMLPFRTGLIFLFLIIVLYEHKKGKLKFNKLNLKSLGIVYLLFLLCTIPSLFVTKSIITSLYTIVKFASFFIVLLFASKIKYSDNEFNTIKKTFVLSLMINVLYGLCTYIFDFNLFKLSNSMYPGAKGRARTTFFNPCYYAVWLLMFTPFLTYKCCEKNRYSLFYVVGLILVNICLLFTFTRSAWLILIMSAVLIVILFWKKVFTYKLGVVLLATALAISLIPGGKVFFTKTMKDGNIYLHHLTAFLPNFGGGSKEKPKDEFEDASLEHREDLSLISKRIAKDNYLTGIGFGAYLQYINSDDFSLKYPDYNSIKTVPHSSFNLMLSETGIFPIIMWSIFIGMLIFKMFNILAYNWKNKSRLYYYSAIGFVLCFNFLSIGVMSENLMYDTQIFPLFLILYGLIYNYSSRDLLNNKKVLFIASTGGHLNELLQLKPIFDKYDTSIITEKTASTLSLKNKYKNVSYLVFGTKDHLFSYVFKFAFNIIKSFILYLFIRPKVIVTTGTHTAVPMCYIGKLFGSKIIFIETFANSKTKTLSGKMIYPIADTFVVQWEEMLKLYPNALYAGWIF